MKNKKQNKIKETFYYSSFVNLKNIFLDKTEKKKHTQKIIY